MNIRNTVSTIALVAVIVGGYFVVNNQQGIADWWFLRSYQPTSEISTLAADAGFNQKGRDVFYVSDPELNNKEQFNVNCPFEERTIVLGCYDGSKIFILEIDDDQLEGVELVTSAHEMLHAAYQRLDNDEKQHINKLLIDEFENTDNQRIIDLVNEYDTSDTELISNELHSILPTELDSLSEELEEYYSRYFTDRLKTVAAAKKYEAVFVGISDEIDSLRVQIDSYKVEIESLEAEIDRLSSDINTQRAKLEDLKKADKIEEYNSLVPGFNSLISQHNALINQLQGAINQHNQLVNTVNSRSIQHNQLIQSIDSNHSEL